MFPPYDEEDDVRMRCRYNVELIFIVSIYNAVFTYESIIIALDLL